MKYSLSTIEREYLRGLARRQADIAALPVMQERIQKWTDMNDAKPGSRPPFVIENWTFDRDFMPESIYQCTTDYGRRLESGFLRHIREYELINDDHVCPDTINVYWHVWRDDFGIKIEADRVEDSEGVRIGFHIRHVIKDLSDGFDMIKPTTFGVNKEETLEEKAFLEEIFGDIMPVVLRSGNYGCNSLTGMALQLMSMETFFTAMYDCPDKLRDLLALLRDNAIRMARWAEDEGLLILNNGNQCTCGTCYNFTTLLPRGESTPGKVKLSDMWGTMDSQETIGVSPKLFDELVFPYYADIAALYGLVYWGCCEPVDPIWEKSLNRLPNLKAVSISRWANQEYMAEALDGKGITFSRKPNPNFLGVGVELDEEGWAQEIRKTLEIVTKKNVPLQFVVRDVLSLHGNLPKARRATEIAQQEIDRFYPR